MEQSPHEKKNKQIGAIYSIGSHVLVILIFFFMIAWRAPDPPMPEIGIELNFGLSDAGSGKVQPESNMQPPDSDNEEEAKPDGLEETPEEVTETPPPDETPIEEVVAPVTTTQDSPDVVEKETKPVIKESPVKEKDKVVEKAPKLPAVLYPTNKTGAGGADGKTNKAVNANQGDKTNATGDQGNIDGTVDSRALYGNAGGGGGSSLQMSGWDWDREPKPNDTTGESGKLVFQVVIDEKGNVIRIITITNTVSPTCEKIYKDEVMRLTFSKTAGTSVASSSMGTITFVIKAK